MTKQERDKLRENIQDQIRLENHYAKLINELLDQIDESEKHLNEKIVINHGYQSYINCPYCIRPMLIRSNIDFIKFEE